MANVSQDYITGGWTGVVESREEATVRPFDHAVPLVDRIAGPIAYNINHAEKRTSKKYEGSVVHAE